MVQQTTTATSVRAMPEEQIARLYAEIAERAERELREVRSGR